MWLWDIHYVTLRLFRVGMLVVFQPLEPGHTLQVHPQAEKVESPISNRRLFMGLPGWEYDIVYM